MMYHPLGEFVAFTTRERERAISFLVGALIGAGYAATLMLCLFAEGALP